MKKSTIQDLGTSWPLIFIRSVNDFKCGEVYKPTRYPCACKMEAIKCELLPFPLVPAICKDLNDWCGLSNRLANCSIFPNPGL